jgi:hypothetical protein
MAVDDPAKKARDKLLDDLLKAHEELYQKEVKRIEATAGLCRSLQKSRSSAAALVKANASASKLLLANDIGSFLTG